MLEANIIELNSEEIRYVSGGTKDVSIQEAIVSSTAISIGVVLSCYVVDPMIDYIKSLFKGE